MGLGQLARLKHTQYSYMTDDINRRASTLVMRPPGRLVLPMPMPLPLGSTVGVGSTVPYQGAAVPVVSPLGWLRPAPSPDGGTSVRRRGCLSFASFFGPYLCCWDIGAYHLPVVSLLALHTAQGGCEQHSCVWQAAREPSAVAAPYCRMYPRGLVYSTRSCVPLPVMLPCCQDGIASSSRLCTGSV